MSDEDLLKNIDSLLFQCALHTRELSQKKSEINQQIKVYRDDIAKEKTNIESIKNAIKGLEEDIKAKQNALTQKKAIAKRMKSTNSLLLQYEQKLKADLETRKANYNQDREEYEKRIVSYRASFQSHKEYYHNNPLAQKLLGLQAENREIEAKIKNYDEQITSKQEELNNLTAPVIQPASQMNMSEGVSEQLSENQPLKQPDQEIVESSDISLQPIMEDHIPSEEVSGNDAEGTQNGEECQTLSSQKKDEQHAQEETEEDQEMEPQDQTSRLQDPSIEEQFTVLEIEQAMELEMDEGPENGQVTNKQADETFKSLGQASSQETIQQTSPARTKPDLTTPTFPFTFSPGRSPQISDSSESPAFSFSLQPEPNTPAFFGFGSHDDPSSPFTSSFFGEKKAAESKASMEFLFNQPEPSDDFQFSFNAKSPDTEGSSKDKARDDFPFSFNF